MGLLVAAGCGSGAVTVNAPLSDPDQIAACERLVAALPDSLLGQPRREIRPADAPAAAWGDPATVLICGGEIDPEEFAFAPCVEADGVGWYVPVEAGPGAAYRIVTVGQEPMVTVQMSTWPPADTMIELAGPVAAHTELRTPCT